MKIQVKNLGPLKKAEFEVADFTIICGDNNTGKTYATYALFGFLHNWKDNSSIDIDPSLIEQLQANGNVAINLERYVNQSQEIVDDACRKYSEQLPKVFSSSSKVFKDLEFQAFLDSCDIESMKSLSYKAAIGINKISDFFSISKTEGELDIVLHLSPKAELSDFPLSSLISLTSRNILDDIFFAFPHSAFIASVERTGISIFRKEIDVFRNNLLEEMARTDTPEK
jgi:AAA ATPase domain